MIGFGKRERIHEEGLDFNLISIFSFWAKC